MKMTSKVSEFVTGGGVITKSSYRIDDILMSVNREEV